MNRPQIASRLPVRSKGTTPTWASTSFNCIDTAGGGRQVQRHGGDVCLQFGAGTRDAFEAYLASRLYADRDRVLDTRALSTVEPPDILASRVFGPT